MKKPTLFVLAGYFVLTLLMTWPVALHLTDAIPGDGFDGWQNYWNLWWVKQALLVEGTNPFFTDYLYAPTGVSLLFHTLNIFNGFWTLPIQLNLGLAAAYNSVVFVSFVLAGYGGYLLSLYTLTRFCPVGRRLRLAAFVGGLVFTMSPFHMAHLLGHMQVFAMMWPPFYVLWLLRTLEPGPTSAGRRRDAALACLFLVLASLVAWYHTLYLLIFTGVTLLWTLWHRWRAARFQRLWQPILLVLAIGLGFIVILSPLLAPMIRDASARPDLETGLVQNITLSADLLAYITPSEMHPLWGAWARDIADNFSTTTSERLIFAGFVPLALAAYILVRGWSSLITKFWALMTATFFILSLGPYLHIGGQIVSIGSWPIPMPYLFLYHTIPFLDLTRSLSRYNLMFMLALGVLVSMALARLTNSQADSSSEPRLRSYIALIAAGLICFEFLPIPYPITKVDTPAFFYDIGSQAEDYTIAELPMNWDRPTPLLHQTAHRKRLLTAYTSRNNPLELAWRTPVFQHWRYLGPDIIDLPLDRIAPTIFFDFNLRYIVLDYWQMPPGPEREATERWVAAALPAAAPVYDDGRLKVYQTPPKQETQPYLSLGEGWGSRQEHNDGLITRDLSADPAGQAELALHHPQDRPLNLEITAAGASEATQRLEILVDGAVIGALQLSSSYETFSVALPPLDRSLVNLTLRAVNGQELVRVSRVSVSIQRAE